MSRERLAIVLWNGALGGAETFSAALARTLRTQGLDTEVIFVSGGDRLAATLGDVPHSSLGLPRGRAALRHPQRLAEAVSTAGNTALLVEPGFLAATLRLGGYRGRIVAVNHGGAIHVERPPLTRRLKRWANDAAGFWAADAEVAVSDVVLHALQHRLHARKLVRIYNGVDLKVLRPAPNGFERSVVGWAGRLIEGKGVDDLIRACGRLRGETTLRVAGDGPQRDWLRQLAASAGAAVEFVGPVTDIASFWHGCSIAAMPSNQFVESFGMAAAEAMACGLPVVAARNGALPEVVDDGKTGVLHERGDVEGIAAALGLYAEDEQLRIAHSRAARKACEERFDIRECARRYRALFDGEVTA